MQVRPFVGNIYDRAAMIDASATLNPFKITTAYKGKMSPDSKFLAAVASYQDHSCTSAVEAVQNSGAALRLLSYTMLVEADASVYNAIARETELCVIHAQDGHSAIVGGNLYQWKMAAICCCKATVSHDLRFIFNKILQIFDGLGLTGIWSDQKRKLLPDKTFLLEHK